MVLTDNLKNYIRNEVELRVAEKYAEEKKQYEIECRIANSDRQALKQHIKKEIVNFLTELGYPIPEGQLVQEFYFILEPIQKKIDDLAGRMHKETQRHCTRIFALIELGVEELDLEKLLAAI